MYRYTLKSSQEAEKRFNSLILDFLVLTRLIRFTHFDAVVDRICSRNTYKNVTVTVSYLNREIREHLISSANILIYFGNSLKNKTHFYCFYH